jgi:Zn-dependent protease/predicted transcriptional regulator
MRGLRIGRIFGIDITLDPSWFIIVALMVYSLGFIEFPAELHPRVLRPRADLLSITLGIVTSLLLFGSVLAHELSHSWMAIQRGIAVKRITLFIFGGVAQIASEPDKPSSELLIAIMGPLMSVALAAVFGAIWLWTQIIESGHWLGISLTPLILVTSILAQANGSLALFNLAPGFPLDGGRVLRAILWGWLKNIRTATLWAARAGQAIALLLMSLFVIPFILEIIGLDFLTAMLPGGLSGIWYALIGMFLWNAASEGYHQTIMMETLRNVTVRQLMTNVITPVAPDISIAEFVDLYLLHRRDQIFPVSDGVSFQGIIGIDQLRALPRAQWTTRRVRELMIPRSRLQSLDPNETAAEALAKLTTTESTELPVIEANEVIGFFGQAELSRYLKLKTE